MLYHSLYDIIECDILYDIVYAQIIYSISYILYNIICDGYISLCSPLPGLHSGLDSFRFNTITIVQLTIHCRQHSTAQSVPFYSCLVPNTVLCSPGKALTVRSRSDTRSCAPLASNSSRNTLLIDYQPTSAA